MNNTNFISLVKIKLTQGIFVFYKDFQHQLFVDEKSGKIYINDVNNGTCSLFVDDNMQIQGTPEDYIIFDPEQENN